MYSNGKFKSFELLILLQFQHQFPDVYFACAVAFNNDLLLFIGQYGNRKTKTTFDRWRDFVIDVHCFDNKSHQCHPFMQFYHRIQYCCLVASIFLFAANSKLFWPTAQKLIQKSQFLFACPFQVVAVVQGNAIVSWYSSNKGHIFMYPKMSIYSDSVLTFSTCFWTHDIFDKNYWPSYHTVM